MKFLKDLKFINVLKITGVALVAIVVIAIAFRLIGSSFGSVPRPWGGASSQSSAPAYDYGYVEMESVKYDADGGIGLSMRNVTGESPSLEPFIEPNATSGDDAEEFEVTEYNAYIETRQLDRTCRSVARLKSRDYVIFENANERDNGCNYVFKVKRDNVDEILAIVMDLNPKDFSESTHTIKSVIEDYTSEVDILESKLQTIDETLEKAVTSYDDLTELATRVQDVASLATIINSKINILERLTQERINISSRLERLQRAKAKHMDRLEHTYFHVDIYENKFVDWERLKDSWKGAIQDFVYDINDIAQGISVNLVSLLLRVLQFALYLVILLVAVKYGWKLAKYIWRR